MHAVSRQEGAGSQGPRPPVGSWAGLQDERPPHPQGPRRMENGFNRILEPAGQVVRPHRGGQGDEAAGNLGKRLMFKLLEIGAGIEVSA